MGSNDRISGRSGMSILNASISYDAVIQRSASFANGVDANSPAWKKLDVLPETESFSYTVDIANGQTSFVKDNIVLTSHKATQVDPATIPAKVEYLNGTSTIYNSTGGIITSSNRGMSLMVDQPFDPTMYGEPIDTTFLNTQSVKYRIRNGVVIIYKSISSGDSENSIVRINQTTGAILSKTRYDDNDLSKEVFRAINTYDGSGNPVTTSLTYKDYYPDGDVKTSQEMITYSNFSITI